MIKKEKKIDYQIQSNEMNERSQWKNNDQNNQKDNNQKGEKNCLPNKGAIKRNKQFCFIRT